MRNSIETLIENLNFKPTNLISKFLDVQLIFGSGMLISRNIQIQIKIWIN